eukprot:3338661-Ditylum_brightwellii.AAC.1
MEIVSFANDAFVMNILLFANVAFNMNILIAQLKGLCIDGLNIKENKEDEDALHHPQIPKSVTNHHSIPKKQNFHLRQSTI